MKKYFRYLFHKLYFRWHYESTKTLLSLGKLHAAMNNQKSQVRDLEEVAFQSFSQRGEDGIIQYIIGKIEIPNKLFVEFGVENYTESNTRFLLMNNNWAGLVIDGSPENIRFIKSDFIYWKYNISAVQSFITRDNINQLIANYTSESDIGLLSVDIDGNDYWVWKAIDVIKPRIVICEYNSAFGNREKVTIPYDPAFVRSSAHYSELYFGASLAAFCELAEQKGYDFIGTAGAGVNAFFVRKDLSASFRKFSPAEGFRESANRDSRDRKGNLNFLTHAQRLPEIRELPVVDLSTGQERRIGDLFALA